MCQTSLFEIRLLRDRLMFYKVFILVPSEHSMLQTSSSLTTVCASQHLPSASQARLSTRLDFGVMELGAKWRPIYSPAHSTNQPLEDAGLILDVITSHCLPVAQYGYLCTWLSSRRLLIILSSFITTKTWSSIEIIPFHFT